MGQSYNDYIKSIIKYEVLTPEEEKEIGEILSSKTSGDKEKAREKLINHNLKYVVKLAQDYKKRAGWKNIPIEDIISAGNMGLITAVDKYDWSKNNRFLTYAAFWINIEIQKIQSEIGSQIQRPDHVIKEIVKIQKLRSEIEKEIERMPATEEIVNALDARFTNKDVEQIMTFSSTSMVSLDNTIIGKNGIKSSDDISYEERIESELDNPEEVKIKKERNKTIMTILEGLPYINRRVLELSTGLADGEEKTYTEISQILFKEGYGSGDKPYTKQYISLVKLKGIEMIKDNKKAMTALQEIMYQE